MDQRLEHENATIEGKPSTKSLRLYRLLWPTIESYVERYHTFVPEEIIDIQYHRQFLEYSIGINTSPDPEIAEILEFLARTPQIGNPDQNCYRTILFGSSAVRPRKPNNDIDLMVLYDLDEKVHNTSDNDAVKVPTFQEHQEHIDDLLPKSFPTMILDPHCMNKSWYACFRHHFDEHDDAMSFSISYPGNEIEFWQYKAILLENVERAPRKPLIRMLTKWVKQYRRTDPKTDPMLYCFNMNRTLRTALWISAISTIHIYVPPRALMKTSESISFFEGLDRERKWAELSSDAFRRKRLPGAKFAPVTEDEMEYLNANFDCLERIVDRAIQIVTE